jgi:hypothetical protein
VLSDAKVISKDSGVMLRWTSDMERPDSFYSSRALATEAYFVQVAYDYFGNAIRDNSRADKIQLGKDIEKFGVDDSGAIDYPSSEKID